MTTLDPARAPEPASEQRRLRLLSWASPLAVVLCAVVWNVGAALLDASPVDQSSSSWGYNFATAIYTVMAGVPLFMTVTLAALLAHFVPSVARDTLVAGVVLCALVGLVMGAMGFVQLLTGTYEGDAVFGVLTVAAAVVLLAPGWVTWDAVSRP